jgi:rare lipoprotein A
VEKSAQLQRNNQDSVLGKKKLINKQNFLMSLMMGLTASCGLLVTSCSTYKTPLQSSQEQDGAPVNPPDVEKIPDQTPKYEPISKYGNPSSYVIEGKRYHVLPSNKNYEQVGYASWYGTKFHGKRTSSGEPYDLYAMTAAHPTLPLPTYAKVKNLENNREVIVKINDRGPFKKDRIIDLSYTAAKKLGVFDKGTAKVMVTALHIPEPKGHKPSSPSDPFFTPGQYLQLGAFKDASNAEKLASKLRHVAELHKLKVHIQETEHKRAKLFTVHFGPLKSPEQESVIKKHLADAKLTASKTVIH